MSWLRTANFSSVFTKFMAERFSSMRIKEEELYRNVAQKRHK